MSEGTKISRAERRRRAKACAEKLEARKLDHRQPAPTFAELQAYLNEPPRKR